MTNKKSKKVAKKVTRSSGDVLPELKAKSRAKAINFQSDYQDILRELAASPTVRYVAGGIATALLTRLANNWAEKYPEISTFIRDNLKNVETKFGTSKNDIPDIQRH